jgi:hypothetical protein
MKNTEMLPVYAGIVAILVVAAAYGTWWYPQQWHACQILFNNRPAQVVCFLDRM